MGFKAAGKLTDYVLAKVSLIRAACPAPLESTVANQSMYCAIIIEKNTKKLGTMEAMRYTPKAIISAGNARKKLLLKHGIVSSWAWVQAGAMEINADDAMGCQELMQLLSALLLEKYYGPGKEPMMGQPWPSIIEVYPFENYLIYVLKGVKYRQGYVLDPVERKCRLSGGSIEVKEMFVTAGGPGSGRRPGFGIGKAKAWSDGAEQATKNANAGNGSHQVAQNAHEDAARKQLQEGNKAAAEYHNGQAVQHFHLKQKLSASISAAVQVMPRVQTGVRWAAAPMQGNEQTVSQGAANSELVTCLVRNWANIEEAARMYVDATKYGLYKPMRPVFSPVDIMPDGHLAGALAAVGIDVFDFARWTASARFQKFKTKGGKKIPKSKFAYTPSNDPSTWKLPFDTPGRAQNALARINQVKGVPSSAKGGVLNKVRKAAKSKGVGVSEKPSAKQSHWAHKVHATQMAGV